MVRNTGPRNFTMKREREREIRKAYPYEKILSSAYVEVTQIQTVEIPY